MRTSSICLILTAVGFIPLTAKSDVGSPSIIAATVEDTVSAQVVRLVVSSEIKEKKFDVVCGEGLIRVRLDGIANRGVKIQDLKVPSHGPIRRVRIVEKNPKNAVLQLFPRRKPLTICERTSVALIGGEILVTTSRSDAEIMQQKTLKEIGQTRQAAVAPKADPSLDNQEKILESIDAKGAKEETKDKPVESKATEKEKKLAFKDVDKDASKSAIPSGEGVIAAPQIAFGFGFAAVVAGLALYLKKKKKFAIDDIENIEILSTKRLGLKQQLMLVSVQDVKFLLAVGEKTVSALGTVPDGQSGQGARALLEENTSQKRTVSKNNVSEVLEHLIGEASRHAALPVSDEIKTEDNRFDEELTRALGNGLRRGAGSAAHNKDAVIQRSNPQKSGIRPTGNNTASTNAAGLVALARMRANLKKNSQKSQIFEA